MAFSFGTAAPAATPFSGGLFGAPAASSASAFGASTAPAFGAASAPAFGASSAPAFGASSAPAFGTITAPAFGAAPAPFGAPAGGSTAPSLFGGTAAPGAGTGLFQQPAAASNAIVPAGGIFGTQPQAQQPAAQARPGLNYKTKFEELPPQMQQELQKIQQEISSYRDECKALDNDARLYDNVGIKQSLDAETSALRQTLQSLYQAVLGEDEGLLAFRERVMVLLRSTETAIRLYQRSKLWREISQAPGPGGQQQLLTQAIQDQMSQPVQLPNPYLGLAVRGFSAAIEQYHSCIAELERVMQTAAVGYGTADEATAILNLPTLVSHMHDYFVHVAARLEKLHNQVVRSRDGYLTQQRARGDYSNPFAEARPLHHIAPGLGKANVAGGAGAGSSSYYSFGGPAGGAGVGANGPTSSAFGTGGGGASVSGFGGGASTAPVSPAPSAALGTATGGAAAPAGGGGLFGGLSPGPFGAPASPFGAVNPTGGFGTPVLGAANAQPQPQQQRAVASRAGSSSSKKR